MLFDALGPHEGHELPLMLMGLKPAALVGPPSMPVLNNLWLLAIECQGFFALTIKCFGDDDHYVITAQGQEWRAARIRDIYLQERARQQRTMLNTNHAKLGLLLGYEKDHIRAFLAQIGRRWVA